MLHIFPPTKDQYNENVTLEIKVENNMIHGVDNFFDFFDTFHAHNTSFTRKFNPPKSKQWFQLYRKIPKNDLNELKLDVIPGFRIKWYYNDSLKPEYFDSHLEWSIFR